MKKAIKVILIILIIVVILSILAFLGLKKLWNNIITAQMAPDNYTSESKTGGEIEAKYLAGGGYETKSLVVEYTDDTGIGKITVWYPAELEADSGKYPVVLFVNGTGVGASRYAPVFRHMASWGFIAIGNEDPSSWEGKKADATLAWLLRENDDSNSMIHGKVDLENIGVVGHSQGGVGVYNTINATEHKDLYKCAVALSPTQEEVAEQVLQIPYDPSKTSIPVLMLCGTENDVITPDNMEKSYAKVTAPKAMAVRTGANHGEMLYAADGYVTAWFMWHLQSDTDAAKAFIGEAPELLTNPLYQNPHIEIIQP